MGDVFRLLCRRCGEIFQRERGGGFHYHTLHCALCGHQAHGPNEAIVSMYEACKQNPDDAEYKELGDLIAPFIAEGPYAGQACACGGTYGRNAPLRCPACRSPRYKRLDYLGLND